MKKIKFRTLRNLWLVVISSVLFLQGLNGIVFSYYSMSLDNKGTKKKVILLDRQILNKMSDIIWSNKKIKEKIIKICKKTPWCWDDKWYLTLDEIFWYSKIVEQHNGDLTSVLSVKDSLDLIKNVDKYWISYCEWIAPAYSFWTVVLLKLAKLNPKINIKLTDIDKKWILCQYVLKNKDKYVFNHYMKTYSVSYRQNNIKKWFSTFKNVIVAPGQTFDLLADYINKRTDYVDWFAIIDGEEKLVPGGGLCGVATTIFQTLSQIKWIDWIRRRSHSEWFYSLYGKKIWWDATIFYTIRNWKHISLINLVWKNSTGWYLELDPWTRSKWNKFITGLKIYSTKPIQKLIIKNTPLKQWPVYKDKNWNIVKDKKGNILHRRYNKIYAIDPKTNKVIWSFNNRYKKIGW